MKKNLVLWVSSLIIALIFIVLQFRVIVKQGEVAVLTTLGKPTREIAEPGLYFKWPWPVQRAHLFDARVRCMTSSFAETFTKDGKNVLIGLYATWQVAEPTKFLQRIGSDEQADRKLDELLQAEKDTVISEYEFSALVNTNPAAVQLEAIEAKILEGVQAASLDRYGIALSSVGVPRTGIPQVNTEGVYARIRSERQSLAQTYRSEGESEAAKIRARADAKRQQLVNDATAFAKRQRGEGQAEAAKHYETFAKDPEFATFLKNVSSIKASLNEQSTIILSTDSAPYDLLKKESK